MAFGHMCAYGLVAKLDWKTKGVRVGAIYLSHLRFADDIVVLAETSRELEKMIHSLLLESARVGLEMNASKTKIITNSQRFPISSNGQNIEYVDKYIYLGKQALKVKWQWAGHISRFQDNRWTIKATSWKGPLGKINVADQQTVADDIVEKRGVTG
ncbi:hypothetical protein MSG28_014440 [Choristoneura fumiferana]|uniref:Uncharacterized protein n=1 Tax=Choristoneura fumiferana TaxID=7141 RepID=A0ACC0JRG4_CHOFU|nr:hypothetical protein MSG28_014440 [Choristoneura fumiferana]